MEAMEEEWSKPECAAVFERLPDPAILEATECYGKDIGYGQDSYGKDIGYGQESYGKDIGYGKDLSYGAKDASYGAESQSYGQSYGNGVESYGQEQSYAQADDSSYAVEAPKSYGGYGKQW